VRPVKRLVILVCLFVVAALLIPRSTTDATGGGGGGTTTSPGPSSEGTGALTHGKLVAGAGGTYLPIIPTDITTSGGEPRNPLDVPPKAPNPEGLSCPPARIFHIGPGSSAPGGGIVAVIAIHPTFTPNSLGGYDGAESRFGYLVAHAIPAGGDPTIVTVGSPATAANVAGHVIAVGAFMLTRGTWHDAQTVAPYGGSCIGAVFSFTAPYLAGAAPPPVPATSVLATAPFPVGADLVAALTRSWTVGTVVTLPGPDATARTFVHIPTCVWVSSDVPTAAVPFHALSATVVSGYTVFLLYDVTVTPGPVTWNWGDGTTSSAAGPVEEGPDSLPEYDPSTQRWTDPCQVSHAYASVSSGATVTATETFSISISVSWSDGVAVHTQPVTCDAATGGACLLPLGAADGWRSGPHPVEQIEPVPFAPPSPTP
jgi:hypothetical protein